MRITPITETELVQALAALARRRGCYGKWGVTEPDNNVS